MILATALIQLDALLEQHLPKPSPQGKRYFGFQFAKHEHANRFVEGFHTTFGELRRPLPR